MPVEEQTEQVFLARQPILDGERKLFAYELLFRSGATGGAIISDSTQATARVLVNALNSMGVKSLVGKNKAFINCDRRMLLERSFEPLDPKVFVLEVLEDVACDDEIAKSVTELRALGFEIALDDFVMTPEHIEKVRRLIPMIQYVKIDLFGNTPQQLQDATTLFKKFGTIQILAEKVESEADYKNCLALGCNLFQGYFFAKPEIITGRKLDPKTQGVMQLLQLLRQDPDIKVLEEGFKRQPDITLNMLRFINSAAVGARSHIDSIRQALVMIGQRKLQQWLMLLLFAGGGPGNSSSASALFDNAAQRARLMENLAKKMEPNTNLYERAFLAGMLSRMDALCRVDIETILLEFDLGEELSSALRENKGKLGDLLKIANALELDDLAVSLGLCKLHEIRDDQLQAAIMESYAWLESIHS